MIPYKIPHYRESIYGFMVSSTGRPPDGREGGKFNQWQKQEGQVSISKQ